MLLSPQTRPNGNHVKTVSKTLKICLAVSKVLTCYISYMEIFSKPSIKKFLSIPAELNIFTHGLKSQFIKAKFQFVKIYAPLDKRRNKINFGYTQFRPKYI